MNKKHGYTIKIRLKNFNFQLILHDNFSIKKIKCQLRIKEIIREKSYLFSSIHFENSI